MFLHESCPSPLCAGCLALSTQYRPLIRSIWLSGGRSANSSCSTQPDSLLAEQKQKPFCANPVVVLSVQPGSPAVHRVNLPEQTERTTYIHSRLTISWGEAESEKRIDRKAGELEGRGLRTDGGMWVLFCESKFGLLVLSLFIWGPHACRLTVKLTGSAMPTKGI